MSVNKTLWISTTMCVIVFGLVGIPGAIAFQQVLQGPISATCAQRLIQ